MRKMTLAELTKLAEELKADPKHWRNEAGFKLALFCEILKQKGYLPEDPANDLMPYFRSGEYDSVPPKDNEKIPPTFATEY